jgi:phosphate:Na+ symporter
VKQSAWEIFLAITQLLGGIGLFLYGMELIGSELQKTAGNKLRMLLSRLTTRRWSGLAVGTLLGFLVHSGPTTIMMVGFINAGLMDFAQSIGVTFGANVGTTLSMQLISFNIDRFCYLVIFVGFMARLMSARLWIKHLGLVVAGFGLLFLGMRVMSDAVLPLKSSQYFTFLLRYCSSASFGGMIAGLLLSTLFTAVIQSSGATIGILFALSSAGIFSSYHQVFALILGAHIGTCAPALMGSIGTSISARRAALGHLIFNVLGASIAMIMYPAYAAVIPLISGSMLRQIANTHTLVQLLTALIFMPFTRHYADFIAGAFPSRQVDSEKSHLDESLLGRPEQAIVAVLKELGRMATITRRMLQNTMRGLLDVSPKRFAQVEKSEEALDVMKDALNEYLIALANRHLSDRQSIIIQHLETATSTLERIGDHIDNIAEITKEKVAAGLWFPDETIVDLIELYKRSDQMLQLAVQSFEPAYKDAQPQKAAEIFEVRNRYKEFSMVMRQKERNRILQKQEDALSGIYLHRYISCFNRIMQHSKTIALMEKEPLFYIKGEKLETQSGKLEPQPKNKKVKASYDQNIFDKE